MRVNTAATSVTQMQTHKALKLHCGWIEDLWAISDELPAVNDGGGCIYVYCTFTIK